MLFCSEILRHFCVVVSASFFVSFLNEFIVDLFHFVIIIIFARFDETSAIWCNLERRISRFVQRFESVNHLKKSTNISQCK